MQTASSFKRGSNDLPESSILPIIAVALVSAILFLPVSALSADGSVNLRWSANKEADLASYNVYYGTVARSYVNPIPVGNVTSYKIDGLVEGQTYYFAVTALDTSGNESGFSAEVAAKATSSQPPTVAYQIVVSTQPDRSNADDLSNQTITGDIYIFILPENNIAQVDFSLDGQFQNTENYAPFDFVGAPFDTRTLQNGAHTATAQITLQDNSTLSVSAAFQVDNNLPSNAPIPLPDLGSYGRIKGGDESHIEKVDYSFAGLSGDVTVNYQVYDVDHEREIEIFINGTRIAYGSVTDNDQWGGTIMVKLPDSLVNNASQNTLTFNNRDNPPNAYWWGVRNVSLAAASTPPSSGGPVALPNEGNYGNIKGGDESHVEKVDYTFSGRSGDVTVNYQLYDVDTDSEIEIVINGTRIAYGSLTANDQWGGVKMLKLPDTLVNNASQNTLTFKNRDNPPHAYWWGVGNVSLDASSSGGPIALPNTGNYGNIKGGDETHVEKVDYTFSGRSGDVTIDYRLWDVDSDTEIEILINGTRIAYGIMTPNDSWGGPKTLVLPGNLVNNSSQNTLTFSNRDNPPKAYWWGVGSVSLR